LSVQFVPRGLALITPEIAAFKERGPIMSVLVNGGVPSLKSPVLIPVFWGDFTGTDISVMQQYLTGLAEYLSGGFDALAPPSIMQPMPTVAQYKVDNATVGASATISQGPFWSPWTAGGAPGTQPANPSQIQVGTNSKGFQTMVVVTTSGVFYTGFRPLPTLHGQGTLYIAVWVSLGSLPSGAAISSIRLFRNQDGHLELFGLDGAGNLYHTWEVNGAFNPWVSMGAGNAFQSVTPIVLPNGCMSVFAVTPQGQIFTCSQGNANNSGTWGGWTQLVIENLPAVSAIAVGINPGQFVQLIAIDKGGVPWVTRAQGVNNNTIFRPSNQLVGPTQPPPPGLQSVVVGTNQDGSLETFCMDAQHNLFHIVQVVVAGVPLGASWNDWNQLVSGGQLQNAPPGIDPQQMWGMEVVANPSNGALELFVLDGATALWRIFQQQPNGNWGPLNIGAPPVVKWACLGTIMNVYAVAVIGNQMCVCCADYVTGQIWVTNSAAGSQDWVAEFSLSTTIDKWIHDKTLPNPGNQQVYLIFTKDIPFANFPVSWGGFHFNSGTVLYAVVPLPQPLMGTVPSVVQQGSIVAPYTAWQMTTSHEVLESATDPQPWKGWVTSNGCEGADVCVSGSTCSLQAFNAVTLPFGPVVGFWDNQQNACSVWTPTP
jgi:hypothetical protein